MDIRGGGGVSQYIIWVYTHSETLIAFILFYVVKIHINLKA